MGEAIYQGTYRMSALIFLVILGILIAVHEFGHFIVAKLRGVRVERFAFGFGPKLFGITWHDTEYALCAFPLGGYVKLAGEDQAEPLKGEAWEFLSKSVGIRSQIILAGPVLNYILAFLIFSFIFIAGSPTLTNEVGDVLKEYPAYQAGILKGDKILDIDGKSTPYWEDITEIIHKKNQTDKPLLITIDRAGKMNRITVAPKQREVKNIFGQYIKIAMIGISPSENVVYIKYNIAQSVYLGGQKLVFLTAITYKAIWRMIIGSMPIKESVMGPVGIFFVTKDTAKMGLIYLVHLIGILSASLAIFNLLPLPVMDGGHIFFLIVEKIRKRPLGPKTQERIVKFGISFLIFLGVLVFYNDLVRFKLIDKVAGLWKK